MWTRPSSASRHQPAVSEPPRLDGGLNYKQAEHLQICKQASSSFAAAGHITREHGDSCTLRVNLATDKVLQWLLSEAQFYCCKKWQKREAFLIPNSLHVLDVAFHKSDLHTQKQRLTTEGNPPILETQQRSNTSLLLHSELFSRSRKCDDLPTMYATHLVWRMPTRYLQYSEHWNQQPCAQFHSKQLPADWVRAAGPSLPWPRWSWPNCAE